MAPQSKSSILVVFGEELPKRNLSQYGEVIFGEELAKLIDPGSVYEAGRLLEELPKLSFDDGSCITKSFVYHGFDLWWMHYDGLFYYFCLPYTQYKRLLEYLKNFHQVSFYRPPYKSLFLCYLQAYECEVNILREPGFKTLPFIPLGILLQILITLLSLLVLVIRKHRLMVFIGDKFEKSQDYDSRMKFIYQELRQRNLPFVEFIRSLESWKTVLQHAFIRNRPVIYSEAVAFVGQFVSILSGGRHRAKRKLGTLTLTSKREPEARFKFLVTTYYLMGAYDEIWTIRIMKWILYTISVKVAFIPAATERNFHAVLGSKLNSIPTIGILHGVASRYSTPYDFMTGFDGKKMFSVDKYGLWSEWWKAHYIKESDAYKPEQLYVSGPMRPLVVTTSNNQPPTTNNTGKVRVLFIAEQAAAPLEVMPYLHKLLEQPDIKLAIKFRPVRDRFENWLLEHESDVFEKHNLRIDKDSIQEAIQNSDVIVGCYSTAVLEALLQLKVPIFLSTHKWGDYFGMTQSAERQPFWALNPEELIKQIKNVHTIPQKFLIDLREQYFGDPHKNGSAWVVDEVERLISM
ncbi:MAG: hypothetical protein Q7K26_03865 [bacterium]|nr:hypothetical protein [bacterium]